MIELTKISKTYHQSGAEPVCVLEDFSLTVPDQQFLGLFGPNGCGKSTLAQIAGGFMPADRGSCTIDSKATQLDVIGYVFQDYRTSLFPWRTVLDNIALPLEFRGVPVVERQAQAAEILKEIGLDLPHGRFPYQLSGGQQQLVAIARALITHPQWLILDEPFAALDYHYRLALQDTLQRLHSQFRLSIIHISHDVDEALWLADRLVILSPRPARIVADLAIPLARPRQQSTFADRTFTALKQAVLAALKGEHL